MTSRSVRSYRVTECLISPVSYRTNACPPGFLSRYSGARGSVIEQISNLLKCRGPISKKYPTDRSVVYRYRRSTELDEVSCAGIETIPNLPKCGVPVPDEHPYPRYCGRGYIPVSTSYRAYRSFEFWYRVRAEPCQSVL